MADFLPAGSIHELLASEEHIFNELRHDPQPRVFFYISGPAVVMGRGNRAEEWVKADELKRDGIPLARRFSGGGTVYLDENVLNYSFMVPRGQLDKLALQPDGAGAPQRYINLFRNLVISALARLSVKFTATRTSDISINGLKVSGNAQRIARTLVLHHGTLMLHCPLAAMERYLLIPPDRPGIRHSDFVTSMVDQGINADAGELAEMLSREFSRCIGALRSV
jgi:lipoate-protein ligase A